MSAFTKSSPGSYQQIRTIHTKAKAVPGKLYYGRGQDGKVKVYKGTHEGRLKEETDLVTAESDIDINDEGIKSNKGEIDKNAEDIKALDKKKADKCYAIAMSIVL